jgi:hypothetical protein
MRILCIFLLKSPCETVQNSAEKTQESVRAQLVAHGKDPMPTRLRVRDKVMFGLLGCCGVAVAIVMFVITLQSEDKEAVSGFRSEWADCAASFLDYLRLRLLTARAVADAVGQYATLPSPNVTQLVSDGPVVLTLCPCKRGPVNWRVAFGARCRSCGRTAPFSRRCPLSASSNACPTMRP